MRIDKIEQMVYTLDKIIERYIIDSVCSKRSSDTLLNDIYSFYHNILQPYCGHLMSMIIIRNELIASLGVAQADVVCNQLFEGGESK